MRRQGDVLGGFSNKTDSFTFNELERISHYIKQSKDWEWLEEWCMFYDINYTMNAKLREKLLLNYRLFNGRGIDQMYNTTSIDSMIMAEEGYNDFTEEIPHFDILTPIAKSLIGQQQLMPLKAMAYDSSAKNVNYRKKKRLELRKQWLNENIIQPIQQQAFQEFMLENNIEDPYELSPKDQQEMQAQVQERARALTPKDIEKFMAEEYKSPSETLIQQITDFVIERDKVKFWTDENFKHFVISGAQYYDLDIRNNKANMKIINPLNFIYGSGEGKIFVEDGDWGKLEEHLSIAEIFQEHGSIITNKDIKKLEEIYSEYYVNTNTPIDHMDPVMATRVASYDAQTGFLDMAPHINTREGQAFMHGLYNQFGNRVSDTKVRRIKFAIKLLRKLKNVTRYDQKTDTFTDFWVSENYERNPKLDVKIEERYFPHVYSCYMYGEGMGSKSLFLDKGPLRNQYKSINNPSDTKLPFYGCEYSKLFENTDNVTIFDLGKPWQDKFNLRVHKYTEQFNTDIGKIFTVATGLKPKDIPYDQWLRTAKNNKVLLLDTSNDVNGIDAQIIKSIDVDNSAKIANILQELEWIKNQAAIAMNYNPSRLGQIAPSMQVTNNQQNIQQSSYQTQDLYSLHNAVLERVLNAHINNEKYSLKDNEYVASYILDDMSQAELIMNKDMIDESEIGISIKNNSEHFNIINKIKEDSRLLMSSGQLSYSEAIRMQLANNFADLINLSDRAEEMKQRELQANREHEMKVAQQQSQAMKEVEQMRQQFIALQNELDRTVKLQGIQIDSDKFRKTMDADLNGQIDALQVEESKQKQATLENAKARQHEKEMLDKEIEGKIKIEKAKPKPKPSKS